MLKLHREAQAYEVAWLLALVAAGYGQISTPVLDSLRAARAAQEQRIVASLQQAGVLQPIRWKRRKE